MQNHLVTPRLYESYYTTWRRAWRPTLVFLPGESREQKSLAGCSPQGHRI